MRIFYSLSLILSLLLVSCGEQIDGNGIVKKDQRAVQEFDEIDISGVYRVYIRQGSDPDLVIQADENLLPYIRSEVRGGKLIIDSDVSFNNYEKLELYITTKTLEEMDLSGAIELIGSQPMELDDLKIDASGGCSIKLDISADKLFLDGSGAISAELKGKVREAKYDLSGAGEIKAANLESSIVEIDMSGAAQADIYVLESLSIDVSGAGEVNYRGNPKQLKQNISGAAEINQL